jgi:hypothetical protein
MSFLPDLMHVYVLPALTLLIPTLLHFVPAFVAPATGVATERAKKMMAIAKPADFFTTTPIVDS